MSGDSEGSLKRKLRQSDESGETPAPSEQEADASKRPKEAVEDGRSSRFNWRDVLLRVEGDGESLTQSELQLLNEAADKAAAALGSLKSDGKLNYELGRSLSQGLENWDAMTEQFSIFIQPLVTFCRLVFDSPLCRNQPKWRREHALALAKLRIHSLFVPVFSLVYDAGYLTFGIDGKTYKVSTKRPLLTEESAPVPGLSAVQASHRYYEYVRRVTGGRRQLLIVLSIMKLCDVSMIDKSRVPANLHEVAFDLFKKSVSLTHRALFSNFGDSWRQKLRELGILFEWSKTFELSVSTLFNTSDQKPEPLFAQLYND